MTHPLIPSVDLRNTTINPHYLPYLREWREAVIRCADDGDVSASACLQCAAIELCTDRQITFDWKSVMDDLLTKDGRPIAYSEGYSKRLYKFGAQYLQTPVHAIHTRWWIECATNNAAVDHARFARMILTKLDPSTGLIIDSDVSETVLRHRMKTELTLSLVLGVEILQAAGELDDLRAQALSASIVDPRWCPPTSYMSAECFRYIALCRLNYAHLFPGDPKSAILECSRDLPLGFCDFPMSSKVDAYMGTAKRTARDKPIHSPLTALHVAALLPAVNDTLFTEGIEARLGAYSAHLQAQPDDIPAFQMRDVPARFGDGVTPIEVICASKLTHQ